MGFTRTTTNRKGLQKLTKSKLGLKFMTMTKTAAEEKLLDAIASIAHYSKSKTSGYTSSSPLSCDAQFQYCTYFKCGPSLGNLQKLKRTKTAFAKELITGPSTSLDIYNSFTTVYTPGYVIYIHAAYP